MPSPKINPTSTWNGLPWLTVGALVIVETNLESIVLERPFLISISSIGERQFVGGLSNLIGFPFTILSPWNASNSARTSSGFITLGFMETSNSAASHNSFAALIETPEKFCLRKTVNLESEDSLHILCN